MYIARIETGFLEVPNHVSTNIYISGCDIQCPDCHNKELWPYNVGTKYTQEELLEILNANKMSSWITLLGGEPTRVLDDLLSLIELIDSTKHFKVCMYTGRYFKDIPNKVLEKLDLIIDGPFVEHPVTKFNTNQTIRVKIDKKWVVMETWEELIKNSDNY